MSVSLSVMTFNLHEDQPPDSPNSWEKRKGLCVSVITNYSPIILCTQQGVKSQLDYLQQCLPGYDQFGISRKGSEDTSDEHCTIFYDKEKTFDEMKVELLEGGTFWLSESPSVPGSVAWGSTVPCIATWVVNTNLDAFSPRARRRSALLTWQHIASLPPTLPVVYCGGFNTQKESTTGRFLLGRSSTVKSRNNGTSISQFLSSLTSHCCDFKIMSFFSISLLLEQNTPFSTCCVAQNSNFGFGMSIDDDQVFWTIPVHASREHGVVGDMRDAWPCARVRKNASLIRTYHGFKGDKQGALEFLKLVFRALCLCWDRQTQDLHTDWILYRGRSLVPILCEVVNDNIDGFYPSSNYPVFAEFMLPRSVRMLEPPTRNQAD